MSKPCYVKKNTMLPLPISMMDPTRHGARGVCLPVSGLVKPVKASRSVIGTGKSLERLTSAKFMIVSVRMTPPHCER